ncbi:MAG: YpdA family putative bacillithiol disulfide reductase [Candidatus Hydrogenedentes bacterium]|nr:YpdA family putative bacillithiol disulfide reductase [Candidatus Hydrogenedentota bacterium]
MKTPGLNEVLDMAVVGAGPAALAALHEAKQRGLRAIAIDKGPVCSALLQHPTYMRWFSTTDKLELAGFPLLTNEKNPTRREYLRYCRAFVQYFGLEIVTYRKVTGIAPTEAGFRVTAEDRYDRKYVWRARNVVFATGFYDSPRPLAVQGGDLPKVTHRYTEAHYYADHEVCVVGAGSSAAEIALELYRAGARVTVVMRGDRFHTKYWIEPDVENRIKEGSIACYRNAEIEEITPDEVVVRQEGAVLRFENDFVLAMTGYEPDTALLESTGAVVDPATKKPVLSGSFETTVPGVYVAGTLCAGCESNVVFVENSREHGPLIVAAICARRG